MPFSLYQGRVDMFSQITYSQSFIIYSLALILGTCASISVIASLLKFPPTAQCNDIPPIWRHYYSLPQPPNVTTSHPSDAIITVYPNRPM